MSISEEFMDEIDNDWAERGSCFTNSDTPKCPKCGEVIEGDPHWWACNEGE